MTMNDLYSVYLLGTLSEKVAISSATRPEALLAYRLGALEAGEPSDRLTVETKVKVLNGTHRLSDLTDEALEHYLALHDPEPSRQDTRQRQAFKAWLRKAAKVLVPSQPVVPGVGDERVHALFDALMEGCPEDQRQAMYSRLFDALVPIANDYIKETK